MSRELHGKQQSIAQTSLECLWRWAAWAERYWWDAPDAPGLGCFGTGYQNWGVQTNQKYLGALAVLAAAQPPDGAPFSAEQALDRALRALRFSLASHVTGEYHCTDGTQWGRTWISALGIERMMHGVELIDQHLTDADRRRVREVIADEADFQLTPQVEASLWNAGGHNRPESNIWNGAVCARAALCWPDHPHASKWLERSNLFWLNGISIPADAGDCTVIAGRPVSRWHLGSNFFPNFALDHHGYLNVGYMVICLSNVAMIHYAHVRGGPGRSPCQPSPALYHHAAELWQLVKRLTFTNGRLARIGGDSRIRYCYCQDYLIPVLAFAADYWHDEHALDLLAGAVELARFEQALNPDGAFHARRLAEIERCNPYYFTRLESDTAVVLSMAAHWLPAAGASPEDGAGREAGAGRVFESPAHLESAAAGGWCEPEHGAVFHRCPTRLASWLWRAFDAPQGLCLPPSDGHLAEWQENLAGGIDVLGSRAKRKARLHRIATFDGGFITIGSMEVGRDVAMPEGYSHVDGEIDHRIVFAALPDGHTAVQMELAIVHDRRIYIRSMQGLKLEIPNDVFNGGTRRYKTARETLALQSHEGRRHSINLGSRWVSVDGVIGLAGIYGAESWHVLRRGHPIGGQPWAYGSILTDALCFGLRDAPFDVYGPAVLLDDASAIVSSVDADAICELCEQNGARPLACAGGNASACRAVAVHGRDARVYAVVANFGDKPAEIAVDEIGDDWHELANAGEAGEAGHPPAAPAISLGPLNGRLYVSSR